ncbi:MAG: DUF6518 family protein [Acidimicrobiia bacterium]|nr:DUF6518 family protein [Acidimicrobiia bacterium]
MGGTAMWAGALDRAHGPRGAAIRGSGALLTAASVYYISSLLGLALASLSLAVKWSVVAALVGPVAGLAGWYARFGPRWANLSALSFGISVVVAEAVVLWRHIVLGRPVFVAVAVVALGVGVGRIVRRGPDLAAGLAMTVVGVVVLTSAFEVVFTALGVIG